MSENKTVYVSVIDGKIAVINGTRCTSGYCLESGCDFPNCALYSGEEFDTEEDAKAKYPNLEFV